MKSKGNNPTALELKWRGIVADFALNSAWLDRKFGRHCKQPSCFEIDHIIGASAKRKVNFVSVKVGEWAIIPTPYELHNVKSDTPLNRTLRPARFRDEFGHEKELFQCMVYNMKRDGYEIPFSEEIENAIING